MATTRAQSVAQVQQSSGGPVPPQAAGKNAIINGAFNVWQRGTSVVIGAASNGYTSDRWQMLTGANAASTVSRQATSDTTNLPFIQYCARVQRNSGQTGATQHAIYQSFESATSTQFVGRSVTMSFYARSGSNFSPTSAILNAAIYSGTGSDQNIGVGGYTGTVAVASSAPSLTSTWTRYTLTGTVGATATELSAYFYWTTVGTAGTNDYFEITGVQLEIGSNATAFQTATGTIQGELAACQRYYWRNSNLAQYDFLSNLGSASTTTAIFVNFPTKVTMRTKPTSVDYANIGLTPEDINNNLTISAFTIYHATPDNIMITTTNSTGVQYRPYWVYAQSATVGASYVGFSAEL